MIHEHVVPLRRVALDLDLRLRFLHEDRRRYRDAGDTGSLAQPANHVRLHAAESRRVAFDPERHRQKLVNREPGSHDGGTEDSPGQLHGRRQHRQRERHLHREQRRPRSAEPSACAPVAQRVQTRLTPASGGVQRWNAAGDRGRDDGEDRDAEDRAERRSEIHPEGQVLRPERGKHDCGELCRKLAREQEAGNPGGCREHEHLDEDLQDDAAPARAESVASRELVLTRDGSCVDEDRDIGAGRDEEERNEIRMMRADPSASGRIEQPGGVRHHPR